MKHPAGWGLAIGLVVYLVVGTAIEARPFVRGWSLLIRASDQQGMARRLASLSTVPTAEQIVSVPLVSGSIRARVYAPIHHSGRAVLLVPGLQVAGIDDPRLCVLARELAASDVAVLTPDFPALRRFEVSPALTDDIEAAGVWLAVGSGLAPNGRIGLIGVSFSGGLAIVAAGRPALAERVSFVFSIGGHDDLPRVLRYLATGVEPPKPAAGGSAVHPGEYRRPHDYGLAVLMLATRDRLAPPDQRDALAAAVRGFLAASYLERDEPEPANTSIDDLRRAASLLPEPSATLLRLLSDRDVRALGVRLLPAICFYGESSALSPARSEKPRAPVYLVHGLEDSLVPSVEAEYLAVGLAQHTVVRLLRTRTISHTDVRQPAGFADTAVLASFLGEMLNR